MVIQIGTFLQNQTHPSHICGPKFHSSNVSICYFILFSMFVLLKGRDLEEAFRIGNEIASAVTSMNPYPVTLKLEKVYQPCFLLTKKRYVGYSYESPDQKSPKFDVKGIETVRRDTCQAVAKTLEKSIRLFFERQDMSIVRSLISCALIIF